MLKRDFVTEASLVAPAEAEEAFLNKLEYTTPFVKAATWLIRLVLHKIRDVDAIRPWYLGATDEVPPVLISELFDQKDRRLCIRLRYLCHIILKYRQGEVPEQPLSDLYRAVSILLNRLQTCNANGETIRLIERRIDDFNDLLRCKKGHILTDGYNNQINFFKDSLMALFGRVSDDFKKIEAEIRGEASKPATTEDLKSIVREVESVRADVGDRLAKTTEVAADRVVEAIEKGADKVAKAVRRKKGRKPKIGVDVQEAVWNIHVRERKNPCVKDMGGGRAMRENEFTHARGELKTYGITTAEGYCKILESRSKRHSRAAVRSVRK